jgi:molecular chaperone GrpE
MKEKKDKEQKKENINMDSDNNKEKESKEKESKKTKGNGDYLKSLVTEGAINQSLVAEELLEEIEFLKKENEDLKKSCDEYLDRIKRTQADYENYRKRTLREQLELIKRANKDLIEKLLPVLDSFENALNMLNMISEKPEENVDEFYKGVRMIHSKLMEILEKEGLKVINPEGEEFDPQICEAAVTEASDEFKDHHIIAVLRKGYMLNDYVIRPAVVKVCVKK